MTTCDCVIIGGGLAGLTTALEVAEAGQKVVVLEADSVVGGRTASWNEDGMHVESGFHRYIGFYSHLPRILKKAGVKLEDIVTWEEKVEVRSPRNQQTVTLGVAPLFGPLKMLKTMTGNHPCLENKDIVSTMQFFLSGLKDYYLHPSALDQWTVQEYAKKHRLTEAAFHYIVIPLSTGIYFLPPERYSAYNFFGLFAVGLPRMLKMRIGAYLGGMTEVMCKPMAEKIKSLGGAVHTNQKVESLLVTEDGRAVNGAKTSDGKEWRGEHTAVAVSLHAAKQLLKSDFSAHESFRSLFALPTMDACTFQIDMKKPLLPKDITTFGPGTCLASFAEQSRTTFQDSSGRLSIILAPPERFTDLSGEETLDIVLKDLHAIGTPLNRDDIITYRKIVHHHDFYHLGPGHHKMRPSQKTPIKGLTLAGDYTMQPFFATMEGAVYSGKLAANCITAKSRI
ncbi:15-cis-phytoene desaturase [Alteribacillus persepolensis]|uniref:15-cis-phytoene desaturase n=1 Tax=Alteribacillus persepolensis TaxID=568899 RepID=A0A1G8G4Q5_9BACI|nr:FAD-dependent oxidoreductase [Alteribacillus persepolensis]SDH89413.1 15-cis-phytoene desaturase [Alteribacillus persepolensis]